MTRFSKSIILSLAILTSTTLSLTAMAADQPKQGGTLVYLEQQAHTNLYPPAGGFYPNGGVLNQITDKLTYQNPKTLEIEPWLAESWKVNDNATEYTFKLRPGVTFSDGTPLDATVVAKNFDTYGLGNKALKQPVSEVVNNYDRSEVIDPHTVKFYFKKPSPGFLQGTSVIGSGIVSLSTLALPFEQLGDAKKIIGSGPFVVSGETIGKTLDLKARDDYKWGPAKLHHQGRAYLDAIKFIVTGEDSVRIGALLAGQADFIRQIQAYDEQQVESQGFKIYAPGTRGVNNSIVFRPDNPLVADIKVRKALSLAVNRDEIIATIFSKNYPKATSILAASAIGYVPETDKLQYDPEKAKALLDEAGYKPGADGIREKDGRKLILTAYESIPQPQSRATLQLIAQQWAKIGVKFNVLAGDAGSKVIDELDPAKTAVAVAMVGRADPDVVKSQYYPTLRNLLLQKGGTSDKVKAFEDTKLNTILDEIASQPDREKRLKAVADAQSYILEQAYSVPLFEEPQAFAGAPYVKGIGFEAVGRPSFYDTWLDK
jgi:peptide/nickel transport system substrate-binding protein